MKIYAVVLACVLVGVFAEGDQKDGQKSKRMEAMKKCGEAHNIKRDEMRKAFEEGGQQVQAFCLCVMKEMGHLNENNGILYDEIKKTPIRGVEPEKVAGFVDECKGETGATPGETAYKFTKCFMGHVFKAHGGKKQQKPEQQLHLQLNLF
ncbi:hypothetical protein FQA39_LY02123 [Lamprigera yunnana]|nr:hypothetical protein FQA39_LY02123 [Lamprigera yunnana]